MKSKYIFKILILILGLALTSQITYSQEEEAEYDGYVTKLDINYLKNSDGIKTLTCKLTAKKGSLNLPLDNAELKFYAGADKSIVLGTKKTDSEGIANLEINKEIKLPLDDSGAVLYLVEYKGLENSKDAASEVLVSDINLYLTLEEIDSVKTITVKGTKIDKNNVESPLVGQDLTIYVKRLYSNLKIGEVHLDEESGEGSTEFVSIPGDSVGNILIIAKIEGHELYSNVEKSQIINWGTPVSYDVSTIKRELWTNEAPLWMAFTLAVFLIGVWYHLIRVFIKMRKIKKMGEAIE